MKLTAISMFALALILAFTSCKKEEVKTYDSIGEFLSDNQKESQFFSFSPDETYSFTSSTGTKFTFYGSTFERLDDEPIVGDIDVELKECYNKADMIFEAMQTTTRTQLLESAGFFFISTKNDGSKVRGQIKIAIPSENLNTDMELFFGSDSIPSTWYPASDSLNNVSFGYSDDSWYYLNFINDFNWINCDVFIDGPKSDFTVTVIKNPSDYNTNVYFILDSINSIAAFTQWDDDLFKINFLPVDYTGKLFAMSFSNGQAYYYLESMTITPVVEKEIELNPVSSSELVEIINGF